MTDRSPEPGRIDLRAFEEPADPLQAERVVSAAMARMSVARTEPRHDVISSLSDYSRPMLAAAAVLLAVVTATMIFTGRRAPDLQPAIVLATWAEAQHVPTNGELLAAFQGYGR